MTEVTMDKIVSLCKRRGFIYQGSEIYGGLAGTFDYGPFGVELKNNVKQLWWKMFVQGRDDMYGVDAAILMNPKVWESSGHVSGFSDPMVECQNKNCKNQRHRVDHLLPVEIYNEVINRLKNPKILTSIVKSTAKEIADSMSQDPKESFPGEGEFLTRRETEKNITKFEEDKVGVIMQTCLVENKIKCPSCDQVNWGVPKQFNMMFKTQVGASEDASSVSYLRPETAAGIFVNFKNVHDSLHPKLPFGIAQIGKAFRNEIAPRDFIFRLRELEQMEIEYFVRADEWESAFEMWRNNVHEFNAAVGISAEKVSELEIAEGDRAHYSKRTIDFEFDFPFGRRELYGLAYRGDFDLAAHSKGSSQNLAIADKDGEPAILPHVIEPSFGVDRTILAILTSAYTEDDLGGEVRTYLKLAPAVAPIKAAVFPLLKNKPELVAKAREVYVALKKQVPQIMWDDNGNVGKRYRRQDEIGTPVCITIDFDTLGENPELLDTVTVRDRDTGEQRRVHINELVGIVRA